MAVLGLPFVGPQALDGGDQANPWPNELPQDSKNVPTFRTRILEPETARLRICVCILKRSTAGASDESPR
jgi:hypothetical protein